ncbi:hypothetical protein [Bradyrhizobium oropedii]|uniref:hypothetical protein n=1 Tax=Bradyrhizobium oropedii TaxID=1571201 RepID=UPI001E36F945|nr:hypothetical protein [Bradyrhizobium oropedii]
MSEYVGKLTKDISVDDTRRRLLYDTATLSKLVHQAISFAVRSAIDNIYVVKLAFAAESLHRSIGEGPLCSTPKPLPVSVEF